MVPGLTRHGSVASDLSKMGETSSPTSTNGSEGTPKKTKTVVEGILRNRAKQACSDAFAKKGVTNLVHREQITAEVLKKADAEGVCKFVLQKGHLQALGEAMKSCGH